MGSFSIWHWVVVLLVIILLFGAKKIPEVAKGLGSGIKDFKKAIKDDDENVTLTEATTPQEATKKAPVKKARATTTKTSKTTTKKTKEA
ncbi:MULTISPECIES: twin-arginine translocase TatA/TatE family subunit [unclassified Helicobacter]|uniref:twin-arginine translocase TatA/TatE family subunit n=1 Tax=unclassified Helicobacter TaxID=2593540 RepID=UPI000CF1A45F|nr:MULTISPECIES: twin-arginine translocase TatA/TatE family subunit [unclassified Helicobacter]